MIHLIRPVGGFSLTRGQAILSAVTLQEVADQFATVRTNPITGAVQYRGGRQRG